MTPEERDLLSGPSDRGRDSAPKLEYQRFVMIRAAAYSFWFTSYPTPLAEVGVRAF